MSRPTPEPPPARRLVWASEEVTTRLERQVRPRVSRPRRIVQAAITAFVFAWLPAFVVFAATTIVAPSATDGAGVGATAFWALQFATLIAVTAMVAALRPTAEPDPAETAGPRRGTLRRLAVHALVTAACAWLVLALQGLSTGQIAVLAVGLVAVLHLLPLLAARLLQRRRR